MNRFKQLMICCLMLSGGTGYKVRYWDIILQLQYSFPCYPTCSSILCDKFSLTFLFSFVETHFDILSGSKLKLYSISWSVKIDSPRVQGSVDGQVRTDYGQKFNCEYFLCRWRIRSHHDNYTHMEDSQLGLFLLRTLLSSKWPEKHKIFGITIGVPDSGKLTVCLAFGPSLTPQNSSDWTSYSSDRVS